MVRLKKYATTTDDDGNETYKTDAEGNILTDRERQQY